MYNQKLLSLARRHALVSKRLSYSCDILNALVFRALTREKPLNTPAIQLQTRLINDALSMPCMRSKHSCSIKCSKHNRSLHQRTVVRVPDGQQVALNARVHIDIHNHVLVV